MATVEVNGVSLSYLERGRGEPLIFVHGSASDYRTWEFQLPVFAGHFRTIAYSRRYHWPNTPIPDGADYLMPEHADDLLALIDALGARPAHVVSHSYGAFTALLAASCAPEAFRSLTVTEPPVITLFVSSTPRPAELARLLIRRPRTALAIIAFGLRGIGPATAAFRRDDVDAALTAFGTATLGRHAFLNLTEPRREQAQLNLIAAELLGSGFPPLADADLRRIRVPTLIVTGQSSPRLFHCMADRVAELIPGIERVEIPGASHIVHEDNAEVFNAAVLGFLGRHPEREPPIPPL